jgi:hypothetical protein
VAVGSWSIPYCQLRSKEENQSVKIALRTEGYFQAILMSQIYVNDCIMTEADIIQSTVESGLQLQALNSPKDICLLLTLH